ncbi:hypothetical protein D3C86_2164780 [compost metagenome]
MPERVFRFVVGFGDDQRQIRFAQDRRAKNLVSSRDTLFRQGQDIGFDHGQQAFCKLGVVHQIMAPENGVTGI